MDHDYVVVSDRFGTADPWPGDCGLWRRAGSTQHFAHMRAFWNAQLAGIAQIRVPDAVARRCLQERVHPTQITRSGNDLDTGVNGYQSEFSHDVMGILTNLFTQGSFSDAQALLTEARAVVGAQGQYVDGLWTYSVPWAVYLLKTGDKAFVEQNFATDGAAATQPSIEDAAHAIAADRTGPMGTMEATNDIDTQGYWTTDDFEALLGLAAYRYIASTLGDTAEASWAATQYASLLAATDAVLGQTISRNHLDYLPCSLLQPNSANRCNNPEDANWTSPIGNWAWEGSLFGATVSGPGQSMIDATYDYGFGRLRGVLPPDTTGGFPGDYYSSAYNAAQGAAGLASVTHRDQGILDYQFMVANSQSGPLSWWESSERPGPPLALGRAASRDGAGLVSPRLGHRRRQQGAAGLPRGAAVGRIPGGRPWHAAGVARPRRADLGDQLPHDRGPPHRRHHLVVRPLGLADLARRRPRDPSSSSCPRSSATLRPHRREPSTSAPGR